MFALVLPFLALAAVEGACVLFGIGKDLSLIIEVPGQPQSLACQINADADRVYFGQHELAGPEPRRFDLPRPAGTYRILVVGGSTVAGFPYPAGLAFPRQMEVLLNQQETGHRFEVLNAGITAINSFSVADIVKQASACQPDLIIVHTGHNEFYGPGGAGSTATVAPPSLYPLAVQARKTRLYQLLAKSIRRDAPAQKHLQESLPLSVELPLNGTHFRSAEDHYRSNLNRIIEATRRAGIPVLLTTVASNLRDHSPVSFLVPDELDGRRLEEWTAEFNEGRQLASEQQWSEAITKLEVARKLSENSSLLHYRIGQCLSALGRHEEARAAFKNARDYDGCRFRAPGSFGVILKDVAHRHSGPDVFSLDVEEALAVATGTEVAGSNLFLEHVHYNLLGHRLLSRILGRFVMTEILHAVWHADRVPADDDWDAALGLFQEDRVSGQSYALQVLDVFPMTKTFDVSVHRANAISRIKNEYGMLSPDAQELFADLSLNDMAARLAEVLGDHFRGIGDVSQEFVYRRADVIRRPWDMDAGFRLARCLADMQGDPSDAIKRCKFVLKLAPHHQATRELLTQLTQFETATGNQKVDSSDMGGMPDDSLRGRE